MTPGAGSRKDRARIDQIFVFNMAGQLLDNAFDNRVDLQGRILVGHNDFPDAKSKSGEVLQTTAKRHGVTTRQVALGFLTRTAEVFAIPKASSAETRNRS